MALEYLPMQTEDGGTRACDCCGYEAPLHEFGGPVTEKHLGGRGVSMFCEVCSATFLSHYVTYPGLYGGEHHLWSSIGWIANRLLDEIRSLKKEA